MKYKMQENLTRGKYNNTFSVHSSAAYVNAEFGWTDYLLSDQLIFSHRTSNYTPKSFDEELHAHDYYELIICTGGEKMQYITDGKCLSIQPGMVILTKPLSIHMFRPTVPVWYDRYILYFKHSLNIFAEKNILNFIKMGNNSYCSFHFQDKDSICNHAARAEQELLNTESAYAASKALLHICNLFVTLSENVADNVETFDHNIPQHLFEIKEYIDKEFVHISSTTELADKFYYSREYISRSFQQYFNTPLYEYILRRKLVYCCSLLRNGMGVENSAIMSGFKNMSGFNRIFHKYYGCTPSEYKAPKRT